MNNNRNATISIGTRETSVNIFDKVEIVGGLKHGRGNVIGMLPDTNLEKIIEEICKNEYGSNKTGANIMEDEGQNGRVVIKFRIWRKKSQCKSLKKERLLSNRPGPKRGVH